MVRHVCSTLNNLQQCPSRLTPARSHHQHYVSCSIAYKVHVEGHERNAPWTCDATVCMEPKQVLRQKPCAPAIPSSTSSTSMQLLCSPASTVACTEESLASTLAFSVQLNDPVGTQRASSGTKVTGVASVPSNRKKASSHGCASPSAANVVEQHSYYGDKGLTDT